MKKMFVTSLLAAMLIASSVPADVYADSFIDMSEAGQSSALVYADLASSFTVTLPKTIKLDSTTKDAQYTVNVKGSLPGEDVINVVPDTSFSMKQAGKTDVTASVDQTKTSFTSAELAADTENGVTETGTVAAPDISAGRWDGTFNFNVSKSVISGLYKSDGSYVSWQSLLDDGTITVSDTGVLSTGADYKTKKNTSSDALNGSLVIDSSVKEIAMYGLAFCDNLTAIEVPEGVTTIGAFAFSGDGIYTIDLPESVESTGTHLFRECKNLTSAVIKCSKFTGDRSFDKCYNMSYVEFSDNVKSLGTYCLSFDDMDSTIQTVIVGNGLSELPNYFAYGCVNLQNVVLSENLNKIGNGAFSNCSKLKEITIPSTVVSIGVTAFESCSKLKEIVIPDGVTSVGSVAFLSCKSLQNVVIPSSLTSISNSMFYGCESLELTVPDTVTSVGANAFYNVKHITYHGSAVYGENDQYWGAKAFN